MPLLLCCICGLLVLNSLCPCLQVAYTFDAGPNACLYLLDSSVAETVDLVNFFFPIKDSKNTVQGLPVPSCNMQVCTF